MFQMFFHSIKSNCAEIGCQSCGRYRRQKPRGREWLCRSGFLMRRFSYKWMRQLYLIFAGKARIFGMLAFLHTIGRLFMLFVRSR